jgi:hypothetical protein
LDFPATFQVLDRGAKAVARGAARCASQVLGRGAEAEAAALYHTDFSSFSGVDFDIP